MKRTAVFVYGVLVYAIFVVTLLYAIGFVEGAVVPKAINDGLPGPVGAAIVVNVLLLSLFAIQHTIMARPGFKRWWTRIIPPAAERSTFVLAASSLLLLLFWQWRPITGVVWEVQTPVLRAVLYGVSLAGFGIALYSSFLIDHFDLFGLRQVWLHLRNRPYHHHPFMERSIYRIVRHPLMLGFLVGFWSAPTMTQGHLLFASVITGYVLFGIQVEERDLVGMLGEDYRAYRRRTPALIPFMKPRRADSSEVGAAV